MSYEVESKIENDYELHKRYIQVVCNDIDPATHIVVRRDNFSNGDEQDYDYVAALDDVDMELIEWYINQTVYATGEYIGINGTTYTAYCLVIK